MTAGGTLQVRDGRRVLRFERRLDHSVERVWAALTEPAEIVGWLAEAGVELVEGGGVTLRWLNTDDEGNQAVMRATITALEPPRLLELEGEPHGRLRWELRPGGGGSLLTLTVTVDAPAEQVTMALAGWHIHLDHLGDALDGRPVDWTTWSADHRDRWGRLHDRYAATTT
jgi:uncharacterized protein YndB with AHSA1/START domain